ncbi:iron complex outermembrane recepter protein (plasmid) [Ketogulonicigenium robustum]|uniref:Iron complex outermembrane recepter protein n=1 Tax=Ketogulonicigenium robustum TaxID=92947 RepID=A0A1W6P2T7_9RHOB|nr:TonB-dependent receptor [Ketogulonicigenium robustum]ARO15825.1 iron complex outermembrane recepter protein [Ketogulonicigenium robustum]
MARYIQNTRCGLSAVRLLRQTALCLSLGAVMGAAGWGPLAVAPAVAQTASFAIPAGALQDALTGFGLQSGLQLFYDAALTNGLQTGGVTGQMAAGSALAQILAGTGLTYRFNGPGAVVLVPVAAAQAGDNLVLSPIRIGWGEAGVAAPYFNPGASSHVAREDIQNFRGSNAADMFRGTAGVMSGDARNSGAGVDVNIRGMQGFGRVNTTIDGAENGISVYQGYQGAANRTYVDPDLIAEVDVNKGSDVASRGIAGSVAMRTIRADDVLGAGETMGYRLNVELGGNTASPEDGALAGYAWPTAYWLPAVATPSAQGMDRPSGLRATQGSVSIAAAVRHEDFDLLLAYALRKRGNYFAGSDGPGASPLDIGKVVSCNANNYCTTWDPYIENTGLTNYRTGEEVLNTQLETQSLLINATRYFGPDATLQLGYNGYFSESGDKLASSLTTERSQAVQASRTTGTDVHTMTSRFRWNPAGNDMIDLRANAWVTLLAQRQVSRSLNVPLAAMQERYRIGTDARMRGADISNTSSWDVREGALSLSYGLSYLNERVEPSLYGRELNSFVTTQGERSENSGFVRASYAPRDWLTLNAGLRYTYVDLHDASDYSGYSTAYFDRDPYRSGGGFSPSFGVTVAPFENTQIYANWSSTLRYASLYESAMVSSFTLAPISVDPERANNWEVGINHVREGLFTPNDTAMVKLSYFNWDIEDYIGRQYVSVPQPNGARYTGMQVMNLDSARFEGAELSARYENSGFSADFAASYFIDMQYCLTAGACDSATLYSDFATNHVPPKFTLDLTVQQKLMDDRLTLGGRVSRVGPRAIDHGQVTATGMSQFISQVKWDPYTLVDLFASYRLNDDVTLSFRVENVADKYYVDPLGLVTQPGPGRTFYVGLTNTFGAGGALPRVFSGEVSDRSGGRDWAGLYAGVYGGRNWAGNATQFAALDGSTTPMTLNEGFDLAFDAPMAGVQLGYNWQFANGFILGVQGDYARPDMRLDVTNLSAEGDLAGTDAVASVYHQEVDWTAALNLRAGYAFDNGLQLYGLAGVARQGETWYRDSYKADYADRYLPNGTTTTLTEIEQISVSRNGLNIGLGMEYALNDNWSIWAQVNRTFFRKAEGAFQHSREGTSLGYTKSVAVGTEEVVIPANPLACERFGIRCTETVAEQTIFEQVPVEGSYERVTGRAAHSEMTNDSIRLGVSYRF